MNSLTLKQHFYNVSHAFKFTSISATCANETIEIGRRRWTTLNILELLTNCKKNMKLIPGQWVLSTAPKAPVPLAESGRDDIEKTRLAASINHSIGTITIHHVVGDANFTHLHDLWTKITIMLQIFNSPIFYKRFKKLLASWMSSQNFKLHRS